jgi:hypothetical protein
MDLLKCKEELAKKKKRLEQQEQLLKVKERKKRTSQHIKLGQMVENAGLSELPTSLLQGALIEIASLRNEQSAKNRWQVLADEAISSGAKEGRTPLIVSISECSADAKARLKEFRFRWNRFRNEWYGEANLKELSDALKPYNAVIEKVAS